MRLVIETLTGKPWHHYRLHPEATFSGAQAALFEDAMGRLLQGEPVQYILGEAWFDGFAFAVGPGVLIPRPETEELVAWAHALASPTPPLRILDLCTGSGCIPVSLARRLPHAEVHALDISAEALAYARANALAAHTAVTLHEADVLDLFSLELGLFDLITCNPPYIPAAEASSMSLQVTAHEPGLALFVPDDDPLLFYNKVAAWGRSALAAGGWLLFEVHEEHAEAVAQAMGGMGLMGVEVRRDMQGKPRMVGGRK